MVRTRFGGALSEHQEPVARGLHGTGAVAFSTRGEYGVRFMVALARMDHGEPVSLTDIAEAEDLPRAYLEQIVGEWVMYSARSKGRSSR